MKKSKIEVQGKEISVISKQEQDYISLTDIARYKSNSEPFAIINNWMRNRNTLEYLGIWETLYNPGFKGNEFVTFKMQAGLHSFNLAPKIR